MADKKISALTGATTPLAGTEVLPIVQSGATVKVATDDLTVRNIRANATTGILQVTGPAAASTRVVTVPNANFTAARTDAAQSFTGDQTLATGNVVIGTGNKGITSNGGLFVQNFAVVASGGTLDLTLDPAGFTGTVSLSYTRDNFTLQSRRIVLAVGCYGTTYTQTQLHIQDGVGGGPAFTLTVPSAGTLRYTDTSGDGSTKSVYLTFNGSRSAG